jgi:hypothetical protein
MTSTPKSAEEIAEKKASGMSDAEWQLVQDAAMLYTLSRNHSKEANIDRWQKTGAAKNLRRAFRAGIAFQRERELVLVEALEFYENTTRLMLDVRDLENPMYLSKSIMDNGDTARAALKDYEGEK